MVDLFVSLKRVGLLETERDKYEAQGTYLKCREDEVIPYNIFIHRLLIIASSVVDYTWWFYDRK